jgi:hypothetical protein
MFKWFKSLKLLPKLGLIAGAVFLFLIIIVLASGDDDNSSNSSSSRQVAHADDNDYWDDYDDDDDWDWDDDNTAAAAPANSSGNNSSGGYSITITGITDMSGQEATIQLIDGYSIEAKGTNTVSGNAVTVTVFDIYDNPYNKKGSYLVGLAFFNSNQMYFYTGGASLYGLGVYTMDDVPKLPELTINSTATTIPFSQFDDATLVFFGGF